MNKVLIGLVVVVILVGLGGWQLRRHLAQDKAPIAAGQIVNLAGESEPTDPTNFDASATPTQEVDFQVEEVVGGLEVPWSLVFTSDTRFLVAERPGRIRLVTNGQLQPQPLISFPETYNEQEAGLMGLTKDPNYQQNHYLYACLAYKQGDKPFDKIIRLNDQTTQITVDRIIVDHIPAASVHAGCRLAFGPDKKLYITTGDAKEKAQAQNKESLSGKILRYNNDGSIPGDNPFSNSPLYSYGHRNPQGIAWHPTSGLLWETEHGPSGFDGPGGGDEVNVIKAGQNYGWPTVSHDKQQAGMVSPKLVFTPAEAPAAILAYSGKLLPQFTNNLFFAALKGQGLFRVVLDEQNPEKILSYEKMGQVQVGRVREVVEGPDGAIYFTSSNRDGRGQPKEGDDKVYRLVPR